MEFNQRLIGDQNLVEFQKSDPSSIICNYFQNAFQLILYTVFYFIFYFLFLIILAFFLLFFFKFWNIPFFFNFFSFSYFIVVLIFVSGACDLVFPILCLLIRLVWAWTLIWSCILVFLLLGKKHLFFFSLSLHCLFVVCLFMFSLLTFPLVFVFQVILYGWQKLGVKDVYIWPSSLAWYSRGMDQNRHW